MAVDKDAARLDAFALTQIALFGGNGKPILDRMILIKAYEEVLRRHNILPVVDNRVYDLVFKTV